ncbi:hypothetical protein ACWEQ8_41075, partial [Streptomyces noursei]
MHDLLRATLALLVAVAAGYALRRTVPDFRAWCTAVCALALGAWLAGLTAFQITAAFRAAQRPSVIVAAVVTDCRTSPGSADPPTPPSHSCVFRRTAHDRTWSRRLDAGAEHPDGSRQQLRVERATGAPHSGYGPALGLAFSALVTSPLAVWPLIEGTRGIRDAVRAARLVRADLAVGGDGALVGHGVDEVRHVQHVALTSEL